MKLFLLALVFAVVMVANSVAKPTKVTKVTVPPELLEEIKLKGFEIFQKYLKWKEGLPPGGNVKFQTFFLEWLKNQKESTSTVAEPKAAVNEEEEASPVAEKAEDEDAKDAEDGKDSQNYDGDEKPSEIPKGDEADKSIVARVLKLCCERSGCHNC